MGPRSRLGFSRAPSILWALVLLALLLPLSLADLGLPCSWGSDTSFHIEHSAGVKDPTGWMGWAIPSLLRPYPKNNTSFVVWIECTERQCGVWKQFWKKEVLHKDSNTLLYPKCLITIQTESTAFIWPKT